MVSRPFPTCYDEQPNQSIHLLPGHIHRSSHLKWRLLSVSVYVWPQIRDSRWCNGPTLTITGPLGCSYFLQVDLRLCCRKEGYVSFLDYLYIEMRECRTDALSDLVQDLYISQLKAYKPAPQVCPLLLILSSSHSYLFAFSKTLPSALY